ncbi:MAG: hypothetical protein QOF84_7856 [Streptomyces sp.]|jgi:hypothetical protein|nr:hypothetical protein [Streptomyces sp.]
MKRHGFDPAALLTGLVLLALAAAFLLDASGAWRITAQRSVPLAAGGLALAAIGALVSRAVRGRRSVPPASPGAGPGDGSVDGQ